MLRPGWARGELVDERFGGVARRPIGEVDVVAGRDERPHDRGADALAAAGDEDPPRHLRLGAEDEAGVLAAEAERVRQHVADVRVAGLVRHHVERDRRVGDACS